MTTGVVLTLVASGAVATEGSIGSTATPSILDRSPDVLPNDTSAPPPDDSVFASLVDRHTKLILFVRSLTAEHEAFERALDRHVRLARFIQRLEAERAAEEQREFDERVSRFLRIRRFMQQLGNPTAD